MVEMGNLTHLRGKSGYLHTKSICGHPAPLPCNANMRGCFYPRKSVLQEPYDYIIYILFKISRGKIFPLNHLLSSATQSSFDTKSPKPLFQSFEVI